MLAEYPQGMSFSSKVNIPHAAPKLGPPPTSLQLTHHGAGVAAPMALAGQLPVPLTP